MKILPSILLIAFLFQCLYLNAQGDSLKEFLDGDFSKAIPQDENVRDSLIQWQEQIKIQLDKKAVMPEDILFFKAFVFTGPERLRVSASEVLKVELLDEMGELIKSQNHKIKVGQTHGSFEIPKKLKKGTYFFRAYTQWMLNYGAEQLAVQEIRVGDSDTSLTKDSIEFYPEGGTLVAGLENKLIMRIEGYPADDLQIVNTRNQRVSSVVKYGENLYSALFRPEKGSPHFLKFNDDTKRPLPSIEDSGYTLQVNNIENDFFDVCIQASPELQKETLYVSGRSNGVQYLNTEVDFKDDLNIDLQIPKNGLPNGIFELVLINEFDEKLAERKLQVGISELKLSIEPIEEKSQGAMRLFSIKVTDSEGKPVNTELSVSLQNHEGALTSFEQTNSNSRKDRYINDLLLLTHQLNTNFETINDQDFPDKICFDFQDGLEFYGQAYDLDNKLISNSKVQILIKTEETNIVKEVQTDSNGMLKLSGLQLEGESMMVFRRIAKDTKSKLVRINPYKYDLPPLKLPTDEKVINSTKLKESRLFISKTSKRKGESLALEKGTVVLDGVTLVEENSKRISIPSVFGIEPTRKVFQDPEMPKTLPQLLLDIPGFQVSGMGGLNPTLSIPRSLGIGPVLWVVDGFPLDQASSSLREVMNLFSFIDIERIEILSGPNASIYGSRASGGVISIYTKSGDIEDYYARKDAQMTFQGYHQSLDFNEYQESHRLNRKSRKLPQTLYWNPSLKTDENGEAIMEVKLPVEAIKIRFEAITITPEGRIGKETRFF